MTLTRLYTAADCAVLPMRENAIVYKGTTGQTFRVPSLLGWQLASGLLLCSANEGVPAEINTLIHLGIVEQRKSAWRLSLNDITPSGAAGVVLSCIIVAAALIGTTVVIATRHAVFAGFTASFFRWETVPLCLFASGVMLLLHEWGHVLAIRTLGGRCGRLLLRWGWPSCCIEVGPLRHLYLWKQAGVLVAGMTVEIAVLGWTLLAIVAVPVAAPMAASFAVMSALHLGCNLMPLPGTDTGRIVVAVWEWLRPASSACGNEVGGGTPNGCNGSGRPS